MNFSLSKALLSTSALFLCWGSLAQAATPLRPGDKALYFEKTLREELATEGTVESVAPDGKVTLRLHGSKPRHITADADHFSKAVDQSGELKPGLEVIDPRPSGQNGPCRVMQLFENGKVSLLSSEGYGFIADASALALPLKTARR